MGVFLMDKGSEPFFMYPFLVGASPSEVSAHFPTQLLTGVFLFFDLFSSAYILDIRPSPVSRGNSFPDLYLPSFPSALQDCSTIVSACFHSLSSWILIQKPLPLSNQVFSSSSFIFRFYIKVFDPFLSQPQTES